MLAAFPVTTTDRICLSRRASRASRLVALGLVALGLAAITTVPTRAATLNSSQTLSIPLTQTNWNAGTPGITNPLQFNAFNPELGTLESVTLSLGYAFNRDISLTFSSPSTLTESTVNSQIVVSGPGDRTFLTATPPPVSESRTDTTGPYPKTITIPTISQTGTAGPLVLTSPADLALFTGSGSGDRIGLPVRAVSSSVFSSSTGNGRGEMLTNASADVTVTYTYTPIPEPSTLAILGVGGAIVLAQARRRRGRQA